RLVKKNYPEIRQYLWKETFWTKSYCLISTGGVSIDVIKQYIERQGQK
ncbi:transposase, partial [Ligilactobacillus ruminis]